MKEARYFYVPDALSAGELPAEEATHALRVLRLTAGDEAWLIDGAGAFHRAEITLAAGHRCLYRIAETLPQEPTWRGHIHLAIAPTKMNERMEWLVEKATEIGFDELTPLACRFSERTQIRADRLRRIAVAAVKQSRKAWVPRVNDMQSVAEFLKEKREGQKFICHCYNEFPRADFLSEIAAQPSADVTVLIGPEGDFSTDEVSTALALGYRSATLGTSRLRTETAGLMAVAMANIARRCNNVNM